VIPSSGSYTTAPALAILDSQAPSVKRIRGLANDPATNCLGGMEVNIVSVRVHNNCKSALTSDLGMSANLPNDATKNCNDFDRKKPVAKFNCP